ncbi:hypothetical protein ABK040_002268 [Willaertia magna]
MFEEDQQSAINKDYEKRIKNNDKGWYVYRGPSVLELCRRNVYQKYLLDTWCSHNNVYSGTPELISDISFIKTNFTYQCVPPNDEDYKGDIQLSDCYGITAIRSFDYRKDYLFANRMSYFVAAMRSGEIYLVRTNIQFILGGSTTIYSNTTNFKNILMFDGHGHITDEGLDYYDHVVFVQEHVYNNQLFINGLYNLEDADEGSIMKWFYPLSLSISKVIQLKAIRESFSQNIYAVSLVQLQQQNEMKRKSTTTTRLVSQEDEKLHYQLLFIKSQNTTNMNTKPITWNIYTDSSNSNIHFESAIQHGNFSEDAPLRINDKLFYNHTYSITRNLILIHNDKEVRIFDFDDFSPDITIDFTQKDLKTTFYEAPNDSVITYAYLMLEKVRRPIKLDYSTNCRNVEYPISQNLFIVIGLKSQAKHQLVYHHVHEFVHFNFASSFYDLQNPVNRPSSFNCQPGQYYDDLTDSCNNNVEQEFDIPEEVTFITSRFMDVNETVNGFPSYSDDGSLNPRIFCEMENIESPFFKPSYEKCVNDSAKVKCEADIFTGTMDSLNLFTFFYAYWQENIHVAYKNNSIGVFGASIHLGNDNTQAQLTIVSLNNLDSMGKITDLYISENNQHLFISVSRKQWELESIKRYGLICETLKTDPDNVFLKPFADECKEITPPSINENQFALISSSCLNGKLCSYFTRNLMRQDIEPGNFVYRSMTEIPCLMGSYCIFGYRIPCPVGYMCPDFGLSAPTKCSGSIGYDTCYNDQLTSPYPCPNGTICTTEFTLPIPASPGHFLLKTDVGNGTVLINGLQKCSEGFYCNLGREVIVTPGNLTLDSLLCPANTWCTNSTVMLPKICSTHNGSMDYCPPGTTSEQLCPAGFYCESPDAIKPCSQTQYCPPGSFTYEVCPDGYYCPNASLKIVCPEGYFCRQGSTQASPCSWFFSSCPEGSSSDRMTVAGLVVVVAIAILILLLYLAYYSAFKLYIILSKRNRKKYPSERTPLFAGQGNSTASSGKSFIQEQFTMDIAFEDLGLVLRGSGKKVLAGVTGELKHGHLTAVMGLSGAGKSTFITTLSNRAYYGTQVGKVFVNGKEESLTKYNRRIGFVPQDDIMIPTMTVEETLYFSAMTRLDSRTSRKVINAIVNDVIHVLRLEDVRHSIIGDQEKRGISGGQRKRVNVGIELVSSPCVLFLDEPTSGLDSASSKEVCEALQAIAKCGINVITVIHQPRFEIFNMFDTLLLLGKGGKTVYLGKVSEVGKYFEELGFKCPPGTNLADFVIDVTAGLVQNDSNDFDPSTLPEIWEQKKHRYTQETEEPISNFLPPSTSNLDTFDYHQRQEGSIQNVEETTALVSPSVNSNYPHRNTVKYKNPRLPYIAQFWMCFRRSCVQLIRSLPSLVLDYFLVFIAGGFLGLIYYNKEYVGPLPKSVSDMCPAQLRALCGQPLDDPIVATSGMIVLAMALTGAMSSLRAFGKESLIFYRESQSGLSTFCYFWAKDLSLVVVNAFAPVVFLSIYYTTVSPRAMVYEYYYVLFLVYWASYGLGYFLSILVPPNISQLTAVVIVFIFNIFSGGTVPLPTIKSMFFPINILPYASYLLYSHENAYLIEIIRYKGLYDVSVSMDGLGYKFSDFNQSWYMVIVFGLIFRILAFIALVCVKPSSLFNLFVIFVQNLFTTKTRSLINLVRGTSKRETPIQKDLI